MTCLLPVVFGLGLVILVFVLVLVLRIWSCLHHRDTQRQIPHDIVSTVKKEISLFSGGGGRGYSQNDSFLLNNSTCQNTPFRQLAFLNWDLVQTMPYRKTCCFWAPILPKTNRPAVNAIQFPLWNLLWFLAAIMSSAAFIHIFDMS